MTRAYFINVSLQLADEEGDTADRGYGFGMRIDDPVRASGVVDIVQEHTRNMLAEAAAKEIKRDRQRAAPFWKRRVGGV